MNDLLRLIERSRRSARDSEKLLNTTSELMSQRLALRRGNVVLFNDIVDIAHEITAHFIAKSPERARPADLRATMQARTSRQAETRS